MALKKGTSAANKIVGTSTNDLIYGYNGNDLLYGFGGNDSIYGGNGNDSLFGGTGNDRLSAESGNDKLFGDSGNDRLYGGSGNDQLNGGTGADTMEGGTGNDIYFVDNIGDIVKDLNVVGGGVDTVRATISYVMAVNIENLQLEGNALNATGNGFSNVIAGNAKNNIIDGGAGNDSIAGGGGSDIIYGGTGRDVITTNIYNQATGAGKDFVYGGAGEDVIFATSGDWLEGGSSGDNFIFSAGRNAGVTKFTVGIVYDYNLAQDVISIANYEDLISTDDIVLIAGYVPDKRVTDYTPIIYGFDTGLGDYHGPIVAATFLYYDNQLIAAVSQNGSAPSTVAIVL